MSDEGKQVSPRAQLREFIHDEIKGKSEVSLPDVTKRAVRFAIKNKEYLKALLIDLLKPIVYEEAKRVIAQSRGLASESETTSNLVQLGDEVVSRGVLKERAAKIGQRWLKHMEHAGSRHVLLMDMTADDLLLAEQERRKRGDAEYGYADLWAKLRVRMESGQRVRDVWSAEEIEAARRSLNQSAA
jgi:hypothetical protein